VIVAVGNNSDVPFPIGLGVSPHPHVGVNQRVNPLAPLSLLCHAVMVRER
jgi:hypothetical protein